MMKSFKWSYKIPIKKFWANIDANFKLFYIFLFLNNFGVQHLGVLKNYGFK
jgi:hypothetical protein